VLARAGASSQLPAVLASFACEPDVKARLVQIVAAVAASPAATAATAAKGLAEHLLRIAAMARDRGAVPLFVSYHFEQPGESVMRTVANEHGVGFVSVRELFAARLGGRRREEVQAADIHCNDEGYRLMAAIVADGLQGVGAVTAR